MMDAIRSTIQVSSQLTDELWRHPKCQEELDDLVSKLSQDAYLDLFSIHEAGHEIYFRKAGVTSFFFQPPRIVYRKDNREKPFSGQWAIIRIREWVSPGGDDWLLKLARGYAAGGKCSVRLTTTDYAGDTIDRQLFEDTYITAFPGVNVDDAMKKDIEKMWQDAQDDVKRDLNEHELQHKVLAKAQEIKPQLFPWLRA
jgi:hypothetical protein